MMTPAQVRAARKLLGWSRDRLAGASGVGVHALQAFEETGHMQQSHSEPDRVQAIRASLQEAGIEFIAGVPGVCLAHNDRSSSEGPITPRQCREARRLLGVTQRQLGKLTDLTPIWISSFERHGRLPKRKADLSLGRIRAALEEAGAEFVDGNRPGVRLQVPRTNSGELSRPRR